MKVICTLIGVIRRYCVWVSSSSSSRLNCWSLGRLHTTPSGILGDAFESCRGDSSNVSIILIHQQLFWSPLYPNLSSLIFHFPGHVEGTAAPPPSVNLFTMFARHPIYAHQSGGVYKGVSVAEGLLMSHNFESSDWLKLSPHVINSGLPVRGGSCTNPIRSLDYKRLRTPTMVAAFFHALLLQGQ